VFAHGIGVPFDVYERQSKLRELFASHGYEFLVARTPARGSLESRARVLKAEIERLVPEGRFHLIGHSMGGLDARLAISRDGLAARCDTLTMLATPNHGSVVADYVMRHLDDASRNPVVRQVLKLLGDDVRAVRDLTTESVTRKFNSRVRDDPRVRYFSMGFYIPEPIERHSVVPFLWLVHRIAAEESSRRGEAPANDGLVTAASARWGESLGDLPADHWSETAPIPFVGGVDYREIFTRILENLEALAAMRPSDRARTRE
jgi:triacylglycerol lipase